VQADFWLIICRVMRCPQAWHCRRPTLRQSWLLHTLVLVQALEPRCSSPLIALPRMKLMLASIPVTRPSG